MTRRSSNAEEDRVTEECQRHERGRRQARRLRHTGVRHTGLGDVLQAEARRAPSRRARCPAAGSRDGERMHTEMHDRNDWEKGAEAASKELRRGVQCSCYKMS